jgi:hypothetical protein
MWKEHMAHTYNAGCRQIADGFIVPPNTVFEISLAVVIFLLASGGRDKKVYWPVSMNM